MSGFGASKKPRVVPSPTNTSDGISDKCSIVIRTELVGVRRDVAVTLHLGDLLSVELHTSGGLVAAVCATRDSAAVVGALAAFQGLALLIRCLQRGVNYEAVVEDVAPTRCAVLVRRVQS